MKINILTERQAKELITKEVDKRIGKELNDLWKYMDKLREEIKILEK